MKRILVCEDEDVIRDFVVINLKRAGYDVCDVGCGEDALRVFEEEHGNFDIVLLDIMMPGTDGGVPPHPGYQYKNRHYHADGEDPGNGQGQRTDVRRRRLYHKALFAL